MSCCGGLGGGGGDLPGSGGLWGCWVLGELSPVGAAAWQCMGRAAWQRLQEWWQICGLHTAEVDCRLAVGVLAAPSSRVLAFYGLQITE